MKQDFFDFNVREKSGPKPNLKYNEIIELRLEGYSYDKISYLLNIPRQTIATICQKHFKIGRFKIQ